MTDARLIPLRGKYAVGASAFAIVDAEDYPALSQYKWKAKPNADGNNIYAVRNVVRDGRHVTLRMHREVLGLTQADACDVDHRNHMSLDNRRDNLRRATRSENLLNMQIKRMEFRCRYCKTAHLEDKKAAVSQAPCPTCGRSAKRARVLTNQKVAPRVIRRPAFDSFSHSGIAASGGDHAA